VPPANAETFLTAIGSKIIASILYAAAVFLGERFYRGTARRNPSYRRVRLLIFFLLWVAVNIAAFVVFAPWWPVTLLTSITLAVVVFRELNQFWQIGLVGADREVKSGIDYTTALELCKHSLHFLGIGATKLTGNREAFRRAIERCNRTEPVKLLLSRPDAEELEQSARMAGRDKVSYQDAVLESLRFIAALRNIEAKNIVVRFYAQRPAFRLMFIDDSICLVSYYVMGKGNGSQLPQLHVLKTAGAQDTEALYFGFSEYFERIWNDSVEWDFQEFL
jgi:hypothetical protein